MGRMPELKDRIAMLEQQLSKLRERRRVQDSQRQRVQAQRAKKSELQKRLLVGGVVLRMVERGEIAEAQLKKWMNAGLTRAEDRALFGLEQPP